MLLSKTELCVESRMADLNAQQLDIHGRMTYERVIAHYRVSTIEVMG